jgi:dTDP-4-amino-4,6-dideoxygalactose transaminase
METHIAKSPNDPSRFARPGISFPNARTAFKAFMQALDFCSDDEVLLPAYVGWSPKEGSGVFDPIQQLGVRFRFYRMTRGLRIDLEHLRAQLTTGQPRLLFLIHYFGYPDPCLPEVVALARDQGISVFEDEAHAMFSDWIGGLCGRYGDAAIFSLHKMLPYESGGLLILNEPLDAATAARLRDSPLRQSLERNPLDYDLWQISATRRQNTKSLLELIQPLAGYVDPLFPTLPHGVIPQTLPIVVSSQLRDQLYFALNEDGFGVVSLYHTLIEPLQAADFPDSHWLARHILNLPVHQDLGPGTLQMLVESLAQLV